MRDMCLRLEAEVAKLRNLLAAAHGTGPLPGDVPPPLSAAGAGGAGAASGAGNPIGGRGSFLSGFAEGGGGGGGGGGGRGLPRMSHMVGSLSLGGGHAVDTVLAFENFAGFILGGKFDAGVGEDG